jgi:hypothetical protein
MQTRGFIVAALAVIYGTFTLSADDGVSTIEL